MIDYFDNRHGLWPLSTSSSRSCLQSVEHQITIISPMIHWVSGKSDERVSDINCVSDLLSIGYQSRLRLLSMIASLTICWVSNWSRLRWFVEYQISIAPPSVEYDCVSDDSLSIKLIAPPMICWVSDIDRASDNSLSIGYQSCHQWFLKDWSRLQSRCLNCGCLLGSQNPCKTNRSSSQCYGCPSSPSVQKTFSRMKYSVGIWRSKTQFRNWLPHPFPH